MGINILGVICMLKISVGGNRVDLAKCAACYESFDSTDDTHDTYYDIIFIYLFTFLHHFSNMQFMLFANLLSRDLKINSIP